METLHCKLKVQLQKQHTNNLSKITTSHFQTEEQPPTERSVGSFKVFLLGVETSFFSSCFFLMAITSAVTVVISSFICVVFEI